MHYRYDNNADIHLRKNRILSLVAVEHIFLRSTSHRFVKEFSIHSFIFYSLGIHQVIHHRNIIIGQ